MGAADARRPGRLPSAGGGLIASGDLSQGSSGAARALWAIRWKVGELLGWDGPDTGVGSRVPTLRDRLPADLRDAPSGPDFDALPFTSLYLLENEFAAEIANRTMHGVMHLGWVPDETGGYRGQMAVLVKPNGLLGTGYMAAIRPFRHLIVYPQMMRQIERAWRTSARDQTRLIAIPDRDLLVSRSRDSRGNEYPRRAAACRCGRGACNPASSRGGAGLPPALPASAECGALGWSAAWHPRPSR